MVLKTIGFLSVMMSTAMSMIAFWTFLRTQNDLQNDWVLSSDFSPGHSSVRVIKIDSELTISRTITRVVAVATGSIAFLQIIFGGYLLTAKGKDIITKSKSWMIFTLGSVGFSWVILTGILILQINGQETITHFVSIHSANLLDCYFHMLAVFAFVHTVEITLLSEFLKFVTVQLPPQSIEPSKSKV